MSCAQRVLKGTHPHIGLFILATALPYCAPLVSLAPHQTCSLFAEVKEVLINPVFFLLLPCLVLNAFLCVISFKFQEQHSMKCVQLVESWFREPAVTGLESNYQLHLVRTLFEGHCLQLFCLCGYPSA